jgi:hypothetical protein
VTEPVLLLTRYRDRLRLLLIRAEQLAPAEPDELRAELVALIDDLNRDLLSLYDHTESGSVTDPGHTVVMVALEAMRNTLRRRSTIRPIRDLLRKAMTHFEETAR